MESDLHIISLLLLFLLITQCTPLPTQQNNFVQRLDHFNVKDTRTWQQRYLIGDNQGWVPNNPILVVLGGESPVLSEQLDPLIYQYSVFAKDMGAYLVILEHRFYGTSIPLPLTLENLVYLTYSQVLSDISLFISFVKNDYLQSPSSRVIVMGCSYSGMLAVSTHLHYPHLVFGSVASSAPIGMPFNFMGYMDNVFSTINEIGGTKCSNAIQSATDQIKSSLDNLNLFKLCSKPNNSGDYRVTNSNLNLPWEYLVQYHDSGAFMNISQICQIMLQSNDSMSHFINITNSYLLLTESPCFTSNYQDELASYRNISDSTKWLYQTCADVGGYPTTDFESPWLTVPLMTFVDICNDLFGISQVETSQMVTQNQILNGDNFTFTEGISRVIFVNGALDPLRTASYLGPNLPEKEIYSFVVDGVSHCGFDHTSFPKFTPPSLSVVQSKVRDILVKWVKSP